MATCTRVAAGATLAWLIAGTAFADTTTRWIGARDYRYGGGSATDASGWRSIAWVWRSEADLQACLRSIFSPADPGCGRLTTIRFRPDDRERLDRVQGCVPPARLAAGMPGRIEPGRWIFVVDVGEGAGADAPRLHRIGSYVTWNDCEGIRSTVQRDLTAEGDDEALEGSRLAAAGACLPEELLD